MRLSQLLVYTSPNVNRLVRRTTTITNRSKGQRDNLYGVISPQNVVKVNKAFSPPQNKMAPPPPRNPRKTPHKTIKTNEKGK